MHKFCNPNNIITEVAKRWPIRIFPFHTRPSCLSPTVSEINGDFSPKSQTALCILHPPMKGFSWNWVSALGGIQKLESWGYRAEKDVWWYLQPSGYNTVHERGGQTDGRTDTADSKVRASTWRRAVKTTFAHTICTWLFQSEYGWTNSAELEFGRVPNQTRQLVQRIAKKILSNAGGHVPTSWRRHCCLSLPPSSF